MDDANTEKLMLDIQLLQHYWPQFEVIFHGDKCIVYGSVGGDENLDKRYEVCIEIPPNYHVGGLPQVYILNEDFPLGTPHVLGREESRICYLHELKYYKRNTMLHQIIGWTYAWLIAYESWKSNGTYGWSN